MAEQTDLELRNNWEGCNLTLRCENLVMKQCSTAVQACVKVMPGFKFTFLCWKSCSFRDAVGQMRHSIKSSKAVVYCNDFGMTSLRGRVFEDLWRIIDFLNLASLGFWVIPNGRSRRRAVQAILRFLGSSSVHPSRQRGSLQDSWDVVTLCCCICIDQKRSPRDRYQLGSWSQTVLTDLSEGGCTCYLRMWFSLITQILTSQRNLFRRPCIYLKACYAFWGPFNWQPWSGICKSWILNKAKKSMR